MRTECIQAVQQAIGRSITKAEERGIEDRVVGTMRRLAAREPERFRTMPRADRLREAARVISEDLRREAELKDTRAALQVEAHARHLPEVEAAAAQRKGFDAIQRKLAQADRYIRGIHREYLRQALDTIDFATKNDQGNLATRGLRWIANLEDPQRLLAFVREVYGQDTGDAGAKAAAKAWVDTDEGMRQRFNAAGGDVRKLGYNHLPTVHNAEAIQKAGIQDWVAKTIKLVDRSRYTDASGRQLNDGELADVLGQAYRDIITDGLDSKPLGAYRGESALANAGSAARVIHFKGGDEYVRYHAEFGSGNAFDNLSGHLRWMAKNIGLVETFGPNPRATFRTLHDVAEISQSPDRVAGIMTTQDMFDTLLGAFDNPRSQTLARLNQGVRSIEVAGKLAGAALGATSDVPLYFLTLGYNRLPLWQGAVNLVKAYRQEAEMKHFANVGGMMQEGLIADMNQWGSEHIGRDWTDRLASATMKASLLQTLTDSVRRAFSVTMMAGMGKLSRTPWEALDKYDRARLETAGWRPEEWAALQQVKLEDWRGTAMLTPEAIMRAEGVDLQTRQAAVGRLLGVILDESEAASPNPDLRTRTLTAGSLQRGTGKGELWRHLMLFKSFSFSILFRHWDRVLNGDMSPASRVAYGSALVFGTTLAGATTLLLTDLVAGRDPRDFTGDGGQNPERLIRFWGAALAKGGGLGFLGDMLLSGMGAQGQSGASAAIGGIAGPVVGSGFELVYDVGLQNVMEAAQGKDTHAGAEAFRWARGHTPLVNLWFGRLALDRAVLDQAQEFLSPGYLAKTRARMERTWGSSWWWEPNDTGLLTGDMQGPQRAPSFEELAGQ